MKVWFPAQRSGTAHRIASGTRPLSTQQKSPGGGFFQFTSSAPGSVGVGPDLLLGEVHQAREQDQEDEDLQAQTLAGLHMRLGGPHQEGGDVLGVLRDS